MTQTRHPVMFPLAPEVTQWLQMLWAAPPPHQPLLTLLPTVLNQAGLLAQHQDQQIIDQQIIDRALAHLGAANPRPEPRQSGRPGR
jgi:hypothetical protein